MNMFRKEVASDNVRTQGEQATVYRVEGFSCANCAGKFEANVKRLPGVRDARVNFGAAKLTVYGQVTVEQLNEAGKFERLNVIPENAGGIGQARDNSAKKQPFHIRHARLLIAGLLIASGYLSLLLPESSGQVSALLFAAAILVGGLSLFKTGLANLIKFDFDMKTLMTVAIIGAALIGEWAEGAVVVVLFAASEALERYAMNRARRSIRSLMTIAPREALVRNDNREISMPVENVEIGELIIVKPGQQIAMDGTVVAGQSTVNQAPITGESIPVSKGEGDGVYAGTLNEAGVLEVRVTRRADDSAIARVIHLVEEAQAERAPAQSFVDTFAKYYTPAIMVLALLVAIGPPLLFDGDWSVWIYQGLSVLVVGCPCALVISTPVSIVTAIGTAARNGVLIKGGIHLETLGAVKAVAFDKTGTLTKGKPEVTDYVVFHEQTDAGALLAVIAALENRANHPLAQAIVRKAEQERIPYAGLAVEQFTSVTGKGISGVINGAAFVVGSPQWMMEGPGMTAEQQTLADQLQREGKTVIAAGTDSVLLAMLAVKDEVRPVAKGVIASLHRLGIQHTVLLTGDNRITARAIQLETGIREAKGELLPEDKWQYVQTLGRRFGKTAMIGDGINDAPALASATVGIAMGGAGSDTALETADAALMGDDLAKLPWSIRLSRKTLAIIKQNISFSLLVKLLALLLVIPGWLTLWIAIASDMGATLVVTLNALRLMKVRGEGNVDA